MLVLLLFIFINTNFVNADDDSSETKYIELLPEKEKKAFIETIARRILEEVGSNESKTHVSGELSDDQLNVHSEYVSKLLKEESENLRRRIEENNNKEKSPREVKEVTLQDLGKEDDGVGKIHELEKAIEKTEHLENDKDEQLSEVIVNSTFHQETESGKIVDEDTVARVENTENLHNEEKEGKAVIDLTLRHGKDNSSKEEITATDRTNDFIPLESFKPKNSKKEAVSIEIEIIDKDKDYEENKKKGEIPVKIIYENEKISRALNTSDTFSEEKAATDIPENSLQEVEVLFKDAKPELEAIKNNRRSLNLNASHNEPNLDNNQEENKNYNGISRKKRMNNSSEVKSEENSAKTHDGKSENEEQETESNIEETSPQSKSLKDLEVSTEVTTIKADDVAANMSTPNKEILTSPDKDNSNSTELDKPVETSKQTELEITSEKAQDITNESTTINMDYSESYSNFKSSTISTVLTETEYTTSEKTATLDTTEEPTNFTTTYETRTKTNDNLNNVQETTSKSEKDTDVLNDDKKHSDPTDENLEPKVTETVQVLRDSIAAYVTSTTVMPLTTTSENINEENQKKPELQIMEAPVIIQKGSIVDLQDQTGPREKIEQNVVVKDEMPKKTLRQGLLRSDFQKKNDRNVILLKIPPKRKEYVVYELLPGQKPFVERNPKPKKTQPLKGPELPERDTRPQKNKYLYEEPSPQIEQPNFARVYNYAPEFAYYNPHNKYGPNADDNKSNIVLLSNENSNHQDNLNSYENNDSGDSNSNIYNKQRKSSPIRSDRSSDMRPTDFGKKKRAKDSIDLDYYFGGTNRKEDRVLRSRIKNPCQSRSCESEEVIVQQLPSGLPNSDSAEHAYNAMLNYDPPVTHQKQVKKILSDIGNFGYHYKYTTTPKVPTPWPSGATTFHEPPIDMIFNRMRDAKKVIRSRLPESPLKVFNSRSYYLDESPNTNDLRFSIKKVPKRSKLINTPYKNTVRYGKQKFDRKKRPLILLTGGLKDLSREIQGRPRQGNTLNYKDMNSFATDYYFGRKESREKPSQKSRYKYKDNTFYDYELVDKKIKRDKDSVEYTYYSDPEDTSSGERNKLKTLDLNAMQLALNLTENEDAQLIFPTLKKLNKLYLNRTIPVIRTVTSGEDINTYVNVLNDMIKTDSNALIKYDWLGTTVDIRSSIKKLKYLSEAIRNGKEDIDPKDLQLLKYIIYLFKSAAEDIQSGKETVETEENVELPRNLRFPISKHLQRLKNSRKYNSGKKEVIQEGSWLSKEGIKDKLVGLDKIIVDAGDALNDLHDAIKHIALITQYHSQRWFQNLKELYLYNPGRKELLEVLLHLSLTKVLDHIEESAVHGLEDNYVSYAMKNPEKVEDTKAAVYFLTQILSKLKSL